MVLLCMASNEEKVRGDTRKKEKELREIVSDKSNWLDAAHWGLNAALEKKAPNSLGAKVLGAPLELARIAGESAYIASSPQRMAENRRKMEDLAGTSVENRLLSGVTNTAGNLVGGAQLIKEGIDSNHAAHDAGMAYSKMLNEEGEELVREGKEMSEQRRSDNDRNKLFMNDVFAKRDAADKERVLRDEEERQKIVEPDPTEEAARIARAIRIKRGLDGGG